MEPWFENLIVVSIVNIKANLCVGNIAFLIFHLEVESIFLEVLKELLGITSSVAIVTVLVRNINGRVFDIGKLI